MLGWVLIGIIGFIIILFVILKLLKNKENEPIRVGESFGGRVFRKLKEGCKGCFRRR